MIQTEVTTSAEGNWKQSGGALSSSTRLQAGEAARELGEDRNQYQPPSTPPSPLMFSKHTLGRSISGCVYLNCRCKYLRETNGLFDHHPPPSPSQAHGTGTQRRRCCRHGCEHSYTPGCKPGLCTTKRKQKCRWEGCLFPARHTAT